LLESAAALRRNLHANCIPDMIFEAGVEAFPEFLAERRQLMARKIRGFYESL